MAARAWLQGAVAVDVLARILYEIPSVAAEQSLLACGGAAYSVNRGQGSFQVALLPVGETPVLGFSVHAERHFQVVLSEGEAVVVKFQTHGPCAEHVLAAFLLVVYVDGIFSPHYGKQAGVVQEFLMQGIFQPHQVSVMNVMRLLPMTKDVARRGIDVRRRHRIRIPPYSSGRPGMCRNLKRCDC